MDKMISPRKLIGLTSVLFVAFSFCDAYIYLDYARAAWDVSLGIFWMIFINYMLKSDE